MKNKLQLTSNISIDKNVMRRSASIHIFIFKPKISRYAHEDIFAAYFKC